MTRSEEELHVGIQSEARGKARLRKYVVTENVTKTVPVTREEVRVEREPITDANRDEALDGPTISEDEHDVVLNEERVVVEKEAVPVERVRLRRTPSPRSVRSTRRSARRRSRSTTSPAPVSPTGPPAVTVADHNANGTGARRQVVTDDDRDGYDSSSPVDRRSVVAREKEEHGGIKFGSAFFGWLTAMGMAVLLTALVAAAEPPSASQPARTSAKPPTRPPARPRPSGWSAASCCWSSVSWPTSAAATSPDGWRGSMVSSKARRLAVGARGRVGRRCLVAVAGNEYNVLGSSPASPRLPVEEGDLTTGGVIALVAVVAASLVGALLGGLAGIDSIAGWTGRAWRAESRRGEAAGVQRRGPPFRMLVAMRLPVSAPGYVGGGDGFRGVNPPVGTFRVGPESQPERQDRPPRRRWGGRFALPCLPQAPMVRLVLYASAEAIHHGAEIARSATSTSAAIHRKPIEANHQPRPSRRRPMPRSGCLIKVRHSAALAADLCHTGVRRVPSQLSHEHGGRSFESATDEVRGPDVRARACNIRATST